MNRRTPYGVRGFSPAFGAGLQSPPKAMDYPTLDGGPDKQVPPENSEGHACRARGKAMDDPILIGGRDKHVPPKSGPDERVPPKNGRDRQVPPKKVGGARLSCPGKGDG